MRLIEFNPRWITGIRADIPETRGKRGQIGITFLCPHCRMQRLGVLFEPPIDDNVLWLFATWKPIAGKRWERSGETFDTLTLIPSVDASTYGHWHGTIKNGEIK